MNGYRLKINSYEDSSKITFRGLNFNYSRVMNTTREKTRDLANLYYGKEYSEGSIYIAEEVEETPVEEVAGVGEAAESVVKVEETPVEAAAAVSEEAESATAAGPAEIAEPVVDKSAETAPVVEPEKKVTRARRVKQAPAAEAAEGTVESGSDKLTETEPSATEEGESDVTAEAGETPQGS